VTDAATLIARCREQRVELVADGDQLTVRSASPSTPLDPQLIKPLREHKRSILALLSDSQRQTSVEEAQEIAVRLEKYGAVLLWSSLLKDFVAFYKSEEDRSKVPVGFVPYSKTELSEMFKDGGPSDHQLKLVHEAKKRGGVVDRHEPRPRQ